MWRRTGAGPSACAAGLDLVLTLHSAHEDARGRTINGAGVGRPLRCTRGSHLARRADRHSQRCPGTAGHQPMVLLDRL
jgi:hypothetical protein